MGVGYQASALHRIVILVVEENAPYTLEPPKNSPLPPMPNVRYMRDPARFRSPDATTSSPGAIGWRSNIGASSKSFCRGTKRAPIHRISRSASAPTFSCVMSQPESSRPVRLRCATSSAWSSPNVARFIALENAILWGFRGRFPQLLLGPMYWLPFQRDMIVEEPDWRGAFNRYGSSFRLADELRDITTFIAGADPRATQWTVEKMEEPDKTLWAAWQAGDAIARVCAAANAHHLPLWTTG